ncbi:MAG: hypothetical protein COU32_04330 [Candidatus Magasanikbacteria bacterium CG10_big_fil_rev_8_21_14_0_10_42_10]|uniref:Rrf2 family transcriptional regulator n=2 Tax=Candidatus Magasanikiibacteriota TaxID=1752731 RepID=A0A2H0TV31_9BACT|nr:MAG: hypothetical protein COU32_04330 [Candidatus Magasanikbacteria bacterium CG10_big_fil_rev_8_21_14_0_10_42_10]PIZ92442.1 MAG: hypothetical protein COX82_04800 [Candidatus Magasanikbacteria bacterium CG_4_10_14_0_2_um_filter_41_10]
MFKLSKQADYAIQLLFRLSKVKEGETLSLRIFSEESNISFLFLQRIAGELKRAKIIDSKQGTKGGYALVRPYKDISLLEVIDAVDKQIVAPCIIDKKTCRHLEKCTIKKGIVQVQHQMISVLKKTPIAQLTA